MRKNLLLLQLKAVKIFVLLILSLCSANLYSQTIFRDDFNRETLGSAWITNYWSIVNGSAFNNNGGPLKTAAAYTDSSYIIETSARGFTNNYDRDFKIIFGQSNLFNDSTYVLTYTQYLGGIMTLGRSTNNVFFPETLDQAAVYPDYNDAQFYKFKIARYKSGLIQVYVNTGNGYGATPFLEAIDSSYQTLGHFGWQEDTQTSAVAFYVDFIQAGKPVIEKPAIREKPAEDSLITQVSAKSGRAYNVAKLTDGINAFTDRNYTITNVPSYLRGASFVQTAMDDKYNTNDDFLTLFVKKDAVVYIAYDPRAATIPAWLSQWTKTGDVINSTDPGSSYLEVYGRLVQSPEIYPYPLILGGNFASPANGAKMNYLVAAIEKPNLVPLQAEDAFLSGAVVANNHTGYRGTGFANYVNASDDYIEWTVNVKVPGNYNIDFIYANGSANNRPLQISDNGTNLDTLPFSPNGSWDTWGSVGGPNVFLTPGIHKIRTTATGSGGPNIDELSLYYLSPGPVSNGAAQRNFTSYVVNNNSFNLFYQVYPNPFSTSTKIHYSLKKAAHVVLTICTLQGQQIELLVNDVKDPGDYEATFYGGKITPGMYLYRLQTGNDVKTGKLVKK